MRTITLKVVDLDVAACSRKRKVGRITDSWKYYESIGEAIRHILRKVGATPLGTQISLHFGQVHPFADPLDPLAAELTIFLPHALLADVIGVDIEFLKERPE